MLPKNKKKNKKDIAAELKKKNLNEAEAIVAQLKLSSQKTISQDLASSQSFNLASTLKLVKMPKVVKATKKSNDVASSTKKPKVDKALTKSNDVASTTKKSETVNWTGLAADNTVVVGAVAVKIVISSRSLIATPEENKFGLQLLKLLRFSLPPVRKS